MRQYEIQDAAGLIAAVMAFSSAKNSPEDDGGILEATLWDGRMILSKLYDGDTVPDVDSQTEFIVTRDQLGVCVEQLLLQGASFVTRTVGKNGDVRVIIWDII